MLELLREDEVAARFRRSLRRSPKAVLAVPFWGKGAAALLGLPIDSPARVLCNLYHPGCNPNSIEDLLKRRVEVRTHPRLHAKIYATEKLAIVGSSNASSYGLTAITNSLKGWMEANACSDDPRFVLQVLDLFEAIWTDDETRPVRNSDIVAAMEARKNWPPSLLRLWQEPRPSKVPTTLLAACREYPDDFQCVYVYAYDAPLGRNGGRLLKRVKSGALQTQTGLSTSDFRKAWGYQFKGIQEDSWLISLNCMGPTASKYDGCAKVTGLQLSAGNEPDLTIVIPGVVTLPGLGRLKVSSAEKVSLINGAKRILKRGSLLPLADAIKIIDRWS